MAVEEKFMENVKITKGESQVKESGMRSLDWCIRNSFCLYLLHEDVALVGE